MITKRGQEYIDSIVSEDALDQETISLDEALVEEGLRTFFKCPGCDFPHLSEQQALNCCTPVQVWECPNCGGFSASPQAAQECCR